MNKIIVILGPTASGKTRMSLRLYDRLKAQGLQPIIFNTDLQQSYIGLNIGVGKIAEQLLREYDHELLSFTNTDKVVLSKEFGKLLRQKTDEALSQEKIPIWVGGSITLLWQFLGAKHLSHAKEPQIKNDWNFDIYTPEYGDRKLLYSKIDANTEQMFRDGLYKEVLNNLNRYQKVLWNTIGYREFLEYSKRNNRNVRKLNNKDLGKIKKQIQQNSKKLALNQINALEKMRNVRVITGADEVS